VPSLRQRSKDLPELIDIFSEDIAAKNQLNPPEFTKQALKQLSSYKWPGNVRQLQNVLQRLLVLNNGREIDLQNVDAALGGDLNMQQQANGHSEFFEGEMREAKEAFEKAYLNHHLVLVEGNVSALAKKIGLERTHLYRKLKSLDINARDIK